MREEGRTAEAGALLTVERSPRGAGRSPALDCQGGRDCYQHQGCFLLGLSATGTSAFGQKLMRRFGAVIGGGPGRRSRLVLGIKSEPQPFNGAGGPLTCLPGEMAREAESQDCAD